MPNPIIYITIPESSTARSITTRFPSFSLTLRDAINQTTQSHFRAHAHYAKDPINALERRGAVNISHFLGLHVALLLGHKVDAFARGLSALIDAVRISRYLEMV